MGALLLLALYNWWFWRWNSKDWENIASKWKLGNDAWAASSADWKDIAKENQRLLEKALRQLDLERSKSKAAIARTQPATETP